jgi:hypothetical protein
MGKERKSNKGRERRTKKGEKLAREEEQGQE